MNIWNGIESYPEGGPSVVATIGNYDGVHLGHQAILRSVVESARRGGMTSVLVTFEVDAAEKVGDEVTLTWALDLLGFELLEAGRLQDGQTSDDY